LNIFIVEDSVVIRDQLVALLARIDDVSIVGYAETEEDALILIDNCKPDLILLDISLRKGNGINVLKKLNKTSTTYPIVAMLTNMSDRYRDMSFELGADAYFDKTLQIDQALFQIQKWANQFDGRNSHYFAPKELQSNASRQC
jgi:two-component system OmpR family response regulator